MTYTQFNIGVFGLGCLNFFLFQGDIGMNIFTTMIQMCLLVVLWHCNARRHIADAHDIDLHNCEVMLLIGNEAANIRKILEDGEMTQPGMAGLAARHIATEQKRHLFIEKL
ncbi:hypothetical protein [Bacillus altitudinis]|uniref:hypothetical protein n=1 Tax=Bacillus altitudinis TaxID=293387 RepID=UPI0036728411